MFVLDDLIECYAKYDKKTNPFTNENKKSSLNTQETELFIITLL